MANTPCIQANTQHDLLPAGVFQLVGTTLRAKVVDSIKKRSRGRGKGLTRPRGAELFDLDCSFMSGSYLLLLSLLLHIPVHFQVWDTNNDGFFQFSKRIMSWFDSTSGTCRDQSGFSNRNHPPRPPWSMSCYF